MKRERYIWSMRSVGRRWGVALTKQQWIINALKDFTFPLAHQDPSEAVQLIHFPPMIKSMHFKTVTSPLLELLPYAASSLSDHHLRPIFGSMGKFRSDSSSSCKPYPAASLPFKTVTSLASLLELLPYADAPLSSSNDHLRHIFGSVRTFWSDSSSSCKSYPATSFPLPFS